MGRRDLKDRGYGTFIPAVVLFDNPLRWKLLFTVLTFMVGIVCFFYNKRDDYQRDSRVWYQGCCKRFD